MADANTPINEMGLYKVYRRLCNRNDAKQTSNKMSEKERAEIIRLHSEGVPQVGIANMVGRSVMSVYNLLKSEGLLTGQKGNRRRDVTVDDVVKLKSKGLCINHIAARLGCSTRLVSDRLKAAKEKGIEI